MTETETQVLAYLAAHNIPYTRAEHPRVSAISDCVLCEGLLGAVMPRNLFLCPRTKNAYCLLIARADAPFRTSSVSKQAGTSRLSFASDEEIAELLHTFPGAVSPLGLIFDTEHKVKLLIDAQLLSEEFLLFHPLENTASVKIKTSDLLTVFLPSCGHEYQVVTLE